MSVLYNYYCAEKDADSISSTIRYPCLPTHINAGVHDVASTFKKLLAGLPGGILGSLSLFDALVAIHSQLPEDVEINKTEQTKIRASLIALAIGTVKSQYRRELIYAVFGLLSLIGRVAETATEQDEGYDDLGIPPPAADLMGYDALGIVFGPLLLGDLINSYTTSVASPHSGIVLSVFTPPKRWRERRKSRASEESVLTSSTVDNIHVANSVAEMVISHWREVVIYMRSRGMFTTGNEVQATKGQLQRGDKWLRSIASETLIPKKPAEWNKFPLPSEDADASESVVPQSSSTSNGKSAISSKRHRLSAKILPGDGSAVKQRTMRGKYSTWRRGSKSARSFSNSHSSGSTSRRLLPQTFEPPPTHSPDAHNGARPKGFVVPTRMMSVEESEEPPQLQVRQALAPAREPHKERTTKAELQELGNLYLSGNASTESVIRHPVPQARDRSYDAPPQRVRILQPPKIYKTTGVKQVAHDAPRPSAEGRLGGNPVGPIQTRSQPFDGPSENRSKISAEPPRTPTNTSVRETLSHPTGVATGGSAVKAMAALFERASKDAEVFPTPTRNTVHGGGNRWSGDGTSQYTINSSPSKSLRLNRAGSVRSSHIPLRMQREVVEGGYSGDDTPAEMVRQKGNAGSSVDKGRTTRLLSKPSLETERITNWIETSSPVTPTMRLPPSQAELITSVETGEDRRIGGFGRTTTRLQEYPESRHMDFAGPTTIAQGPEGIQPQAPRPEQASTPVRVGTNKSPSRGTTLLRAEIKNLQKELSAKTDEVARLRRQVEAKENVDIGSLRGRLRSANLQWRSWRERAEIAEKRVDALERLAAAKALTEEQGKRTEVTERPANALEQLFVPKARAEEPEGKKEKFVVLALAKPKWEPDEDGRKESSGETWETDNGTTSSGAANVEAGIDIEWEAPDEELFNGAGMWMAAQGLLEPFGEK